MVEKQWTEVENKNGRLINEISDQNQGGNEKKIFTKKMAEIGEEGLQSNC